MSTGEILASAQENPGTTYDRDGQPDIVLRYAYDLLSEEPHEGAWGSWSSQYANEPPRAPFLYEISAKVAAGGTLELPPRHSGPVSIRSDASNTGRYEIRFTDRAGRPHALPGAIYNVQALVSGASCQARVAAPGPESFTLELTAPSGALADAGFFLTVTHPPVWNLVLS